MLIPRIIPCLLIEDGAMVKTRKFEKRIYLGDPINVVNLFNQFEVDEIVLLDIGASVRGRGPDLELINRLAEECWVPLTYGGGITRLDQIEKIVLAGVEKVVVSTAAARNMDFVEKAAREFGSQSVVGSVDAKKKLLVGYETRYFGGRKTLDQTPAERAQEFEKAGAGEILLQSVNRDGEMKGYDLDLIKSVTEATNLPVVACSGAAQRDDLIRPIKKAGASATAAGSLFVFSGLSRGVLINFPERSVLEGLLRTEGTHDN
jgi:imidazole glycerol-phosphate synthase subunit HisF